MIPYQFETLHALAVAFDCLEEHLCRAHPKSVFAVQRAVDDHLLQRLGVLGEPLDAVEVPLEVPELAPDQLLSFFNRLTPPSVLQRRVCGDS